MAAQYEWAHVSVGFRLVDPDELAVLAPDGNEDREYGLEFSTGSNGCMVYGALEDLHQLGRTISQRTVEAVVGARPAVGWNPAHEFKAGSSMITLAPEVPVEHEHDPVNRPSHYATGWSNGAEVIDITENLNFNRGNAVKYIARAGKKDSAKELEDLEKAAWYLNREIERLKIVADTD